MLIYMNIMKDLIITKIICFYESMIREQIKNNYDGFAGDYRDASCVMVRFSGDFLKMKELNRNLLQKCSI